MGRKIMNGRSPSFFKVLIGDFTTKLKMPPAFLKNFNGNLPKISILKSITGKSWRVIMEKNDEGFFFSRGWSEFVKDHRLEEGDFLLFWFVDKSTFEVMIYGRTACEKDIGFASERRTMRSNQFKKSQVSRNVSCAILKRKRSYHKNIESKQKEEAEAVDFIKPNHPYFVMVLRGYQKCNIVVPKAFAKETGLIFKKSTVVKDTKGSVWPVDVRMVAQGRQVHLSTGWSAFWVAKGLAAGDKCLFQFIKSAGNVLHVQILSEGAGSSGSGPAKQEPMAAKQ